MKILFINGSPNANGNTAALAKKVLNGKEADIVNLTDYQINVYGQEKAGDQFAEILEKIKSAELILLGSPVYWHNLCGSVRTLLDRFYGPVQSKELKGRKLIFLYQGAAPEKWMIEAGEYTIDRFAKLYGFEYLGMATNESEAVRLAEKV